MATALQQLLRSLCSGTEWTYAVFWRLKPHPRMILSWDDAYYENCGTTELSKVSTELSNHFDSLRDSDDPIGSALTVLSHHAYSLGKGLIGHTAVTGKHKWIWFDDYLKNSHSSFEDLDAWRNQVLAGIKTVLIMAVPNGVLQLGSVQKVNEDMKLVTYIRDIFHSLQDASLQHQSIGMHYNVDDLLNEPNLPLQVLLSEAIPVNESNLNTDLYGGHPNDCSSKPYSGKQINGSNVLPNCVGLPCISSGFSNSSVSDGFGADGVDAQVGSCYRNISSTSLRFSTISELHEALGPGFQNKSNLSDSKEQKIGSQSVKVLEEINTSEFTEELGSDNLLEAIVTKACSSCFDEKSEKSLSEMRKHPHSIRTTANFSKLTINSEDYSIENRSHMDEDCFQSCERSLGISSSAISSTYPSSGIEVVRRSSEPAKSSRKRSRPSENHRPRPRDRQLIQDRLKELRELVPDGSKCSIDSLLERTIKHMLFLQSVTKHADELNKFTESKFRRGELGMMGSSKVQGSSLAVEVGSHLKVHSIMVENLPKNGQLLVEMLCEDCSHFLEIADAMRSLGLTILKGATEAFSDKKWICFVVEGHNNTSLHRMDILWSLVQTLQFKASPET